MPSFKVDESVFDKLADMLKKHCLSEIEYQDGGVKIRISSASCVTQQAAIVAVAPSQQQPQDTELSQNLNYSSHKGAVTSKMVGTCYTAPEPGAPNFVSVGDSVQEGQPILIIEAMKVMNLIKSPVSGKVIHFAVSNGEPIEYGQLLLVVE